MFKVELSPTIKMRYLYLVVIFLICAIEIQSSPVDSLRLKLSSLPREEQFNIISNLPFYEVVSNSHALIPLLKEYEQVAIQGKEFKNLARIYLNLSLAYYYNGKYDETLKYGLMAVHLYDSLGCRSELGTMYGELGYRMKYSNLPKAFDLMRKGITELEALGNPEPLAKIYDNYGVLHEINKQVDSAIHFYRKALAIKRTMNDSLGIPFSLNNFFMAYLLLNQYDSAYKYLEESTRMRLIHKDPIGLAENYNYYNQYYSSRGDYRKAIEFSIKSLEISKKHGYNNLIKSNYADLSASYEQLKDFENALKYHKLFSIYQDSLINLETNKTVADLQVQFETAEKEKELIQKTNQLKQQKAIKILILVGSCILIMTILVYFWIKLLIAKRNERIKIQNALIDGEQAERNRLALELHDGVANDLNGIILLLQNNINKDAEANGSNLNQGIYKLHQTHQMVRKLSHSLMPRSLTEKGLITAIDDLATSFQSDTLIINTQYLNLDNRLPQIIEFNLFRIVQEAINNIIKHSKATKVLIDFNRIDGNLLVNIEDNGVGFDASLIKEKKGIGIQNIINRVKMINGNLAINSTPGRGTTIEISIPIK